MGCRPDHRNSVTTSEVSSLVTLCAVVHVLTSLVLMSSALPTFHEHIIERHKEATSGGRRRNPGLNVVRHYTLHSRCSGKYVIIDGRHVTALASRDNSFADLRVETVSFDGLVRIQSALTRDYLCFSKQGRLTVRPQGEDRKCVFRELHAANDYTEFSSSYNSSWYLGFSRNGRRLAGDLSSSSSSGGTPTQSRRPSRRCYQFMKDDPTTKSVGVVVERTPHHRIRHADHRPHRVSESTSARAARHDGDRLTAANADYYAAYYRKLARTDRTRLTASTT